MKTIVGSPAMAGLVGSLIAGLLICRLPDSQMPRISALAIRAVIYVLITTLGGFAGIRLYWNRSTDHFRSNHPLSLGPFVLINAAGWVWVPSIILLSHEDSLVSLVQAVFGSAVFAAGLRKVASQTTSYDLSPCSDHQSGRDELFARSVRAPPREAHAYVIAICIYLAAYAVHVGETLEASGLMALCSFICVWKLTLAPIPCARSNETAARDASRLTYNALTAVLITLFALFYGVGRRDRANATFAPGSGPSQNDDFQRRHQPQDSTSGISGYESIILWPIPSRKKIVALVPAAVSSLEKRGTKRITIRFDGAYWYFQPPNTRPGPRAHHADGSPLALNIQVNNFIPLNMEAHQRLGTGVPLKNCAEIQVSIKNRDNRPGSIVLAVLLSDSASPQSSPIYLGQQPVTTSAPAHFSIEAVPSDDVLRFPIPERANIRKFDEISVSFRQACVTRFRLPC